MLVRLLTFFAVIGFGVTTVSSQEVPPQAGAASPPTRAAAASVSEEPALTVDEALDLARRAIDRFVASQDPVVRAQAGHDLDRGLAIVKTQSPHHPWLPYLYAFVSLKQGQSWDAVDHLQSFVSTRDGRTEWKAYRTLGDLVVKQFPRLARSYYEKAASLIDGEPSVLYGLSRCAANVGDYTEALDLAKQTVVADHRTSVEHLTHLARVASIKKDWLTAIPAAVDSLAITRQVVADHPGLRDPLLTVNAQYKLLIEIETARLKDVREPAALSSGFIKLAGYARERSKIVTQLSKHDVVAMLGAGLERLGEDATVEILEQAVIAYDDVDRVDDAIDICHRILAKQPDHALAREWLARLGQPVAPVPKPAIHEEDHDHDGEPDH